MRLTLPLHLRAGSGPQLGVSWVEKTALCWKAGTVVR